MRGILFVPCISQEIGFNSLRTREFLHTQTSKFIYTLINKAQIGIKFQKKWEYIKNFSEFVAVKKATLRASTPNHLTNHRNEMPLLP